MTGFDSTHPRFLRPIDVARLRRNQNRIHVQRVVTIARNVALAGLLVLFGLWVYRHTRSDARFAVQHIELLGAVHTTRTDLDLVTARYLGTNLFQIDIARLQADLGTLPWVSRVAVEKKLPDTLRIRFVEREPFALVVNGTGLRYVDDHGRAFAGLSPQAGNSDLPVIRNASGAELMRTIDLIRRLRTSDAAIYSRISEITPIAPDGFSIFDRELGAVVFANANDISEKWRGLYAIVHADRLAKGSLEYADLRFTDRIVIKPRPVATTLEGAS
jgi:cell division septal protein FtsQ